MKKEILTRDKINMDLMSYLKCWLLTVMGILGGEILVILLLLYLLVSNYAQPENKSIIMGISIVIGVALFVCVCFSIVRIIIDIKNNRYIISKDTLIEDKGKISRFKNLFRGKLFKLDALAFKSYGIYEIQIIDYYKWSKNFEMSRESVYNSSNIGDEFYLVTTKKEKILMVYNCKMFELKSESHT